MRPEKLPFVPTINIMTIIKLIRKLFGHKTVPVKNFGLKRDTLDVRDRVYVPRYKTKMVYPETTERRHFKFFPFRWDQGSIGSCTGHGASAAFVAALLRNDKPIFDPSRLFAYYNARDDASKGEDSGASIRDVIKGLNKYGLCKEETWPYIESKFAEKPSIEAFTEGEKHQTIEYYRIYPVTKEAIMDAIYNGYAVVYGQILYESFMSEGVARTGLVPYPKCFEDQIGGHCKCIMDYEKDGVFELNSWGKGWGSNGGCLIPWKYVLDSKKSFDFWVIKTTEA